MDDIEFIPSREVKSNFIVRFLADKGMDLSSYLAKKCYPYAIMYTAIWNDEEEED